MSTESPFENPEINLSAGEYHYGIVAARFNEAIVERLLTGAIRTLEQHGATESQISLLRVPGAFEIPLACQKLAHSNTVDAIIALGCVIRGETPHFNYVCAESARGINEVSLKFDIPIMYGILTTNDMAQAVARSNAVTGRNHGSDAAKAAMEMLNVYAELAAAKSE